MFGFGTATLVQLSQGRPTDHRAAGNPTRLPEQLFWRKVTCLPFSMSLRGFSGMQQITSQPRRPLSNGASTAS